MHTIVIGAGILLAQFFPQQRPISPAPQLYYQPIQPQPNLPQPFTPPAPQPQPMFMPQLAPQPYYQQQTVTTNCYRVGNITQCTTR